MTGGQSRVASVARSELLLTGVTLELLQLEHLQQHPNGYRCSAFCRHYREWLRRQRVSMRQVHPAGEKRFVDYSGEKPEVVDPVTGVVQAVELFVAVLAPRRLSFTLLSRREACSENPLVPATARSDRALRITRAAMRGLPTNRRKL